MPESEAVQRLFTDVVPRYDCLNHLLSGGIDFWWRRTAARRLQAPPGWVLDLCCGTGDLVFALRRQGRDRVVGVDFVRPMLTRAAAKGARRGRPGPFLQGDALRLPFAAGGLTGVTIAFGLRNLADPGAGLREIHRALAPGGRLAVLEFSVPTAPLVRAGYLPYLRWVLPPLSGWISGQPEAYRYLADTIQTWPAPPALADQLRTVGFRTVTYQPLTGGIACLHLATR